MRRAWTVALALLCMCSSDPPRFPEHRPTVAGPHLLVAEPGRMGALSLRDGRVEALRVLNLGVSGGATAVDGDALYVVAPDAPVLRRFSLSSGAVATFTLPGAQGFSHLERVAPGHLMAFGAQADAGGRLRVAWVGSTDAGALQMEVGEVPAEPGSAPVVTVAAPQGQTPLALVATRGALTVVEAVAPGRVLTSDIVVPPPPEKALEDYYLPGTVQHLTDPDGDGSWALVTTTRGLAWAVHLPADAWDTPSGRAEPPPSALKAYWVEQHHAEAGQHLLVEGPDGGARAVRVVGNGPEVRALDLPDGPERSWALDGQVTSIASARREGRPVILAWTPSQPVLWVLEDGPDPTAPQPASQVDLPGGLQALVPLPELDLAVALLEAPATAAILDLGGPDLPTPEPILTSPLGELSRWERVGERVVVLGKAGLAVIDASTLEARAVPISGTHFAVVPEANTLAVVHLSHSGILTLFPLDDLRHETRHLVHGIFLEGLFDGGP